MAFVRSTFRHSLVALIALHACFDAMAAARADACLKYATEVGWSKGYAVEATVIEGSDLNARVGGSTRFRPFATYAVVFWGEGQATILELPPLSMGSLPMFESDVQDQNGRSWKIKEGHLFCY